ncbi:DNA alkylation repair enzyme (macronuclear) [Tetrahymena thermophila SB210]|uniref:DNA alkylation repair enzyme n=1 Tax=Tetrahymena thermophila (strain SB210) TaxID=312017 RepID=W7XHD5_TETTS|nr:DNA alkylation repair enzyme [Tetrahymena thermophila SB210]EWS72484.1 DNA alkylation repair enzyme [Tetrahymena thermophila SB210]|eukprot:XP_012654981.1 DNA alkylation repair enzyme [Tetrahymena thermophila SB210]
MTSKFKQLLYNRQAIEFIGNKINDSYPAFDQKLFLNLVFDKQWEKVETKQCIVHVSEKIHLALNKSYLESLEILLHANKSLSFNYSNFVFPEYVSLYGLDYFEESMNALKEFTRNSSSEFAIRQFMLRSQTKTMQYLYEWTKDQDYHVRRLASEGCRPILPWGFRLQQLVKDPTPIIPILEQLNQDPELYVQRSVSNNLNDISRHHPDLVIQLCREWSKINNNSTKFIIKKAFRTILKQGNQEALQILGVGAKEQVRVSNLKIHEKNIKIGSQFTFSFDIEDISTKENTNELQLNEQDKSFLQSNLVDIQNVQNSTNQKKTQKSQNKEDKNIVRIEYKIYYLKKNGKHLPKVFMMRYNYNLKNKVNSLQGRHKVEQVIGKIHYPGIHYISIIVNGIEMAKEEFYLHEQEQ